MAISIFDIIILVVAVLIIVMAAKKGFAKTILDAVTVVVAVVGAYVLSEPLSAFITNLLFKRVVVFIILFIVLSIVIKFVVSLFSKLLDKIPLVGSLNSLLGGALGLIKAGVLVFVVCTLLYLIVYSTDNVDIKAFIADSYVYQFMTENNPIIDFIQG